MAGDIEALGTADETPQDAPAKPEVVVVVVPQTAAAAETGAPAAETEAEAAAAATEAPAAAAEAPAPGEPDDRPTARHERPERGPAAGIAEDDLPTSKIQKPRKRARTADDDRLIAAVIPLDLKSEPGPLSDYLGKTLLFRAARAAALAGAPRLILLGRVPEDTRRELYEEAYAAFLGRPVEVRDADPTEQDFGPGRVLVLDSAALHDGEALGRLAQVKGEKTALLLGPYGDGLRVRTQDGRVAEVGSDISDADGRVAGSASVPVEQFEGLAGVGERAALERLGTAEELVGTVAPRTFAQQFQSEESLRSSQHYFYDRLASTGNEGVLEDWLASGVSRKVVVGLLRSRTTPASISVLAGLLALLGAAVLAFGTELGSAMVGRAGVLLAGVCLIGSAILDRVDGELARLRLDEDEADRALDFGLDHVAHMLVFLGLAWHVDRTRDLEHLTGLFAPLGRLLDTYGLSAINLGFIAAAGVLLLGGVLLWRGPPRSDPQPLLTQVADFLATTFGSRDYFYLLIVAGGANLAFPTTGVMALFLIATTLLVHVFWIAIFLLSLVSPPRD